MVQGSDDTRRLYEVKTRVIHDTNGTFSQGDVTNRPCPAITIGVGGMNSAHYKVEYYLTDTPPMIEQSATDKPPYCVPSMEQIAAVPWNGYSCASSFSGCGGSSLGYKMAGFKVLWANEFIPAAQDTYRANHPSTLLDTRDIRIVQPEEILEAIGMRAGELDLFDGSPPCASFSTAGKREESWGKVKQYSDTKQRTDDLFFEYVRLVRGVQPKVFVAENVSGLVKGTAKGYFKEILQALKDCGYNVKARLLDAQWLGVPQMRQRIIFIGVRNDLDIEPAFPSPLPYRYSVRDALPWIEQISHAGNDHIRHLQWRNATTPSPSILQSDAERGDGAYLSAGGFVIAIRQGNKNGHSSQRGDIVELAAPAPTIIAGGRSGQFEVEEETDISRYAIGREWERLAPGDSTYYGGRLWKPDTELPSPTITQKGGDHTAASVCHPTEKRKFSIAELKRICAFPDDFALTGTYAQQWERLGRAVPPVMMSHIAIAIRDGILAKL